MSGAWLGMLLLVVSAMAGDWPSWRGPAQDGTSTEAAISPAVGAPLWTFELPARGTPVVWGDRVYLWGYEGKGEEVAEVLVALDLDDGSVLWKRSYRDFLSDIIYERYSLGSPAVDPGTGQVYLLTSAGELLGVRPDGRQLWSVSMMELLGRLTFPNGKTGAPIVVEDLVIVHGITANWGREGPARDRFYAFDKEDGTLVWSSTPGTQPQDSSWSTPMVVDEGGRLVLYATTGCGHLVALDARTGEPLWRTPIANGGVNMSPVRVGDLLVAAHAVENLDSTRTGGMFAVDVHGATAKEGEEGAPVNRAIRWRNDIDGFSSSPVVVDGVVYQVNQTGDLYAVDGASGAILWTLKLSTDQLHASPVYAGGRLYVPMRDGTLHTVEVSRAAGRIVSTTKLEGEALGAPAVAHGRLLVATTRRLYVFGAAGPIPAPVLAAKAPPSTGTPTLLRARPAEVILRPGESVAIAADLLDAQGRLVRRVQPEAVVPWIPPTAKVKSEMKASFKEGRLTAPPDAGLTAGAFQVKVGALIGTLRGRTVSGVPYAQDFQSTPITETDAAGAAFGWPPLPWIGARFKWDVREVHGSQVLAKTLDRMLFQRAVTFLGHPDEHDYEMRVDLLSDGNSRQMSAVGVVHQRYIVALKGNQRVLEVSSNQERLKRSVPFVMEPGVWYTLRTSVTSAADGTVTVRARAWKRGEAEPSAWTIEVVHPRGHTHGAPGAFGFTPQNLHSVYLDNLVIGPAGGAK